LFLLLGFCFVVVFCSHSFRWDGVCFCFFCVLAGCRKGKERLWWTATKWVVVLLVVVIGLLVVGYSFLRQTYIPMETMAVDVKSVAFQPRTFPRRLSPGCCVL